MRVLLDECVHKRLADQLLPHTVTTVPQAGLRGVKNGELLRIAAGHYDVLVTSDKNIEHQHNPDKLPLPIVVLAMKGNMWEDIEPVVPKLRTVLDQQLQNAFYKIG